MTPLLAVINTVGSLVLCLFLVVAVGVAGDDYMATYFVVPFMVVAISNVLAGWIVVKNPNHKIAVPVWRVTQTVVLFVFLFLVVNVFV